MRTVIGSILASVGTFTIIMCAAYAVVVHPEWTQSQALRNMLIPYCAGLVLAVLGGWMITDK